MRCYGDKPASFLAKVPSGLLPALVLDGKLYTESATIASLLEASFPGPLLPPAGSAERRTSDELFKLERTLFGTWLQWLTNRQNDGGYRVAFERVAARVEDALTRSGGPFFLGKDISLVDITFAPFLERIAASLLYYKGYAFRGGGAYPRVDAWFAAMSAREPFRAIQSDYFTHAHGACVNIGEGEGRIFRNFLHLCVFSKCPQICRRSWAGASSTTPAWPSLIPWTARRPGRGGCPSPPCPQPPSPNPFAGLNPPKKTVPPPPPALFPTTRLWCVSRRGAAGRAAPAPSWRAPSPTQPRSLARISSTMWTPRYDPSPPRCSPATTLAE